MILTAMEHTCPSLAMGVLRQINAHGIFTANTILDIGPSKLAEQAELDIEKATAVYNDIKKAMSPAARKITPKKAIPLSEVIKPTSTLKLEELLACRADGGRDGSGMLM